MKIYTKTGDSGQTSLFGGLRVDKDDVRVEAYGSVDEANSVLGLARSSTEDPALAGWLEDIQADLFSLGAELACPPEKQGKLGTPRIEADHVERLEALIDSLDNKLAPLKNFILPGGTIIAAQLHHARTVVRRAERRVQQMSKGITVRPMLLVYLNRLSDLLFVLARYENHRAQVQDVIWSPRAI
jgi:cob(I)alamin adenosyltransferase